jgi:outer membrane protein TolC
MQQFEQAEENLAVIEREMLPKLTEAIAIAERGFADGGTDYLLVLQTTTQYLDARSRALIERANRQRARAELERSISRSLSESPLVPSLNELKTTSQNRDLEAISTETDRTIESENP